MHLSARLGAWPPPDHSGCPRTRCVYPLVRVRMLTSGPVKINMSLAPLGSQPVSVWVIRSATGLVEGGIVLGIGFLVSFPQALQIRNMTWQWLCAGCTWIPASSLIPISPAGSTLKVQSLAQSKSQRTQANSPLQSEAHIRVSLPYVRCGVQLDAFARMIALEICPRHAA